MARSSKRFPVIFAAETALRILSMLDRKQRLNRMQPVCFPASWSGHPTRASIESAMDALACTGLAEACSDSVRLLTNDRNMRSFGNVSLLQCTKPIRGKHLLPLAKGVFVVSAPLAFVQFARQHSFLQVVRRGYDLCATYRPTPQRSEDGTLRYVMLFGEEPLTSTEQLHAFLQLNQSLDGVRNARRALRYVANGSASPRETQLAIILALPMRHGGYGLEVPLMNKEVRATKEAQRIAGRGSFRCDLFWKDARLDVEYQSREFHQGEESRINDSRRMNALRAMGYSVLTITNEEIESLSSMDVIARTIAQACGKRFRITLSDHKKRQMQLRRGIGLPLESRSRAMSNARQGDRGRQSEDEGPCIPFM